MARLPWTQKQDIGPSARAHGGLAYDSVRKLTYSFGGGASPQNTWTAYGDTWAWDGRYWTQVARFGPRARVGHTMTFDTSRSNTVVFGGDPATSIALCDTWVFDGVDWTQVEDIGPSPRTRHAAAYDSARQRVVLFGGEQGVDGARTFVNDTWEWDGESWTQVEATGPGPRSNHAMAFDSVRNRTVLFGGGIAGAGGAVQPLSDTWEWNGDVWTEVADTGPVARNMAAMTSTGGLAILHGGAVGGVLMADTWQWLGGHWSKMQEMGPSPRCAHVLSYDSDRQKIVLFSGESNDPRQTYLADTWEAKSPPAPSARAQGPDNLTVSPSTVSLANAPNTAIEFDVAGASATRNYVIYLVDAAGRRQPVGEGVIPPGVTHLSQAVPGQRLTYAFNVLGLAAPATVSLATDLGSSTVALQITA
jgi:hypothetical protein